MTKKDEIIIEPETKKFLDEAVEMNLYFIINDCGGFIWRMNHDMSDGRIPKEHWEAIDKDIAKMRVTQEYALSQLPRIGVEHPLLEDKTPSTEYWAWFRWWDSYIKGLSNDQWTELDSKITAKQDVSSYRPEGDWRNSFTKEEVTWETTKPCIKCKSKKRSSEGGLCFLSCKLHETWKSKKPTKV